MLKFTLKVRDLVKGTTVTHEVLADNRIAAQKAAFGYTLLDAGFSYEGLKAGKWRYTRCINEVVVIECNTCVC